MSEKLCRRVYIGNDLPSEYTGSKYTYKLKGTVAKAKANAAQGIPELLETAQSMWELSRKS